MNEQWTPQTRRTVTDPRTPAERAWATKLVDDLKAAYRKAEADRIAAAAAEMGSRGWTAAHLARKAASDARIEAALAAIRP